MLLSKKKIFIFGIIILIILSIVIRLSIIRLNSFDLSQFLIPWTEHLKSTGFRGLSTIDSNYNVPYLYLLYIVSKLPINMIVGIKLFSIAFDILLCVFAYFIFREFRFSQKRALLGATLLSFLPTLLLNSSLWGQCDVIYVSLGIGSWLFLMKNKQALAWSLFGLAFAFKIQAIFFLPFLLYWFFAKNQILRPLFSQKNLFFLTPFLSVISFLLICLPAILFGDRSIYSIISVYVGNSAGYPSITMSAANIWSIVGATNNMPGMVRFGIIFTAVIVFAVLLIFILQNDRLTKLKDFTLREKFILPFILSLIIPFFLPNMTNRYFFAAEIFAVIFALISRKIYFIVSAIILQFIMFITYQPILWPIDIHGIPAPFQIGWLAAINASIICAGIYVLFRNNKKTEVNLPKQ